MLTNVRPRTRRSWIVVGTALAVIAAGAAVWAAMRADDGPTDPVAAEAEARLGSIDRWALAAEAEIELAGVAVDLADEGLDGSVTGRVDRLGDRVDRALSGAGEAAPDAADVAEAFERLGEQARTDDPAATDTVVEIAAALRAFGP